MLKTQFARIKATVKNPEFQLAVKDTVKTIAVGIAISVVVGVTTEAIKTGVTNAIESAKASKTAELPLADHVAVIVDELQLELEPVSVQ